MNLNVANCPRCGRLFQKGMHNVCGACVKEEEDQFNACVTYIKDNRNCTINELSNETGVTIRQITKFIKDGRIFISDNPNMGYPCDSCGEIIRSGKLCSACSNRITQGIQKLQEEDQRKAERESELHRQSFKFREEK